MTAPPKQREGRPEENLETATRLTTAIPSLTADDAYLLDSRIRLLSATIGKNLTRLTDLIRQARDGEIHLVLGHRSWTAYLASALGQLDIAMNTPARRELVALLSDEGMSNRAIAQAVGVDPRTVRRDREQVGHSAPPDRPTITVDRTVIDSAAGGVISEAAPPVTGLDGKTYKNNGAKKKPPTPKPANSIEEEPDGDTHTLWSPDVTITVTSRIDYDDLRPWALSLYQHTADCDCHCWWTADNAKFGDSLGRFSKWLANFEKNPEFDVFGATNLYLDPLFVIANMATWIAEKYGGDSIKIATTLIDEYQMWDFRVTKIGSQ